MTVQSVFGCARKTLMVAALAAALAAVSTATPARADTITDDNVEAAMKAAKTAADHQALADYFTAKSKAAAAEVERHRTMSKLFSGKGSASWEAHCHSLMKTYEAQAKDYAALAKEQAAVAAALQKQ